MRYIVLVILALGLVSTWSGCKNDDTAAGTLTIHFRPVYDGQTLTTFTTRPFDSGQQIQMLHMSMLISDLLLYRGGTETHLDDVELVDVSFDDSGEAMDGYIMTLQDIPAATYDGIQFGIGVPSDINLMRPSDFPSTSPLSLTGYYWHAWNSYIFTKAEGRLDTMGTGAFDVPFAFHTGSDALFRELNGAVPIVIKDGQDTELHVLIDYQEWLKGIDIKSNPQNHNPEDSVQIQKIVNNMADAFTLSL